MKTLKEIKKENEEIVNFGTTQSYSGYELLFDTDYRYSFENTDLNGIIEYTLHRMKEEGFTDEEINYNSNMYIPTDEEWEDLNEYEEFSHVDLGYIVGGLITHFELATNN